MPEMKEPATKSATYDWREKNKPQSKSLERIEIEPAANGFVVRCSFVSERKSGAIGFEEPMKHVFGDAKEVASFVNECITRHGMSAKSAPPPTAPGSEVEEEPEEAEDEEEE